MKFYKNTLSLILLCMIILSVFGINTYADTIKIETGKVDDKDYIIGDNLYYTDFEDESVDSLPKGWEIANKSFGYNGGGTSSAKVAKLGSYGNVLTFSATGIDTWISMPEIKTRNYIYEVTFVTASGTTSGSFGIANGMYGGIGSATGALFTSIPVKYAVGGEGYYRSKGIPSVQKVDFSVPVKTPPGTTVKMKFISLDGFNHYYINDYYMGAFSQGDNESTSDWAGFYTYNGTFHATEVSVTEILKSEVDLNNVTLNVDENNANLDVSLSFDKRKKVYKNNISGDYSYSETAPLKFGVLVDVRETSAIDDITTDTEGVTNHLFKSNSSDKNKLYFDYSIENIPAENLDKFYIIRPYTLIGESYFYSEAHSYSPSRIANNIYSLSDDDMKERIQKVFKDSTVFKTENINTLTFSLFSDFHYKENMYTTSIADLRAILKRAEDNSAQFIISGGDFCNDFAGSPELTNTYLNYTKADGSVLPAYNIYGNHELETSGNSMENVTPVLTNDTNVVWGTDDGSFDSNIGYYYFESNGFRIVCTDTNYSYDSKNAVWEHNESASYGPPTGNTNANSLGPVQLVWLEKVLTDAATKGIPCIVIGHDGFSGEFATSSSDAETVREIYARVNAVRAGTVVMSINGHHHTNHQGYVDGVFYFDMNTARNGFWSGSASSTEYHYSNDHTYLYEEYDEKGNLLSTYEKKINSLWQSHFTWFFEDPLSAIVTVDEFGKVTINGMESSWLYDIVPDTDASGVEPRVTSGIFWDCDSLGHIWGEKLTYNETHHWYECEEKACSISDISLNKGYEAHNFEEIESEEFLVEGTKEFYYKSCLCGAVSDDTFGNVEIPITQKVWDGSIANSYAGGSGTANDPYLIENASQLARMIGYDVLTNYSGNTSNGSTDKYYKLISDIYINDISSSNWYNGENLNEWYSSTQSRFCGSFNGNGYTVYGLYFAKDATNAGLFPVIDFYHNDRVIENVTISDSYIVASSMAGAFTSRVYGGGNKTLNFKNCYVDESVILNVTNVGGTAPWCGGFSGFTSAGDTTVINVKNSACLATDIDGSPLKYGLIGINLTWNQSLYLTIENTFAYARDWQGITLKGSVSNSYLISDFDDIKGENAKTNLSAIEGFYFTESYPLNTVIGQLKGDVNGDSKGNSLDLAVIKKCLLNSGEAPLEDINADGISDLKDLVNLKKKLSERSN